MIEGFRTFCRSACSGSEKIICKNEEDVNVHIMIMKLYWSFSSLFQSTCNENESWATCSLIEFWYLDIAVNFEGPEYYNWQRAERLSSMDIWQSCFKWNRTSGYKCSAWKEFWTTEFFLLPPHPCRERLKLQGGRMEEISFDLYRLIQKWNDAKNIYFWCWIPQSNRKLTNSHSCSGRVEINQWNFLDYLRLS